MPNNPDEILAKLKAARKDLLDLSSRNPLLNYRALKNRGVEVVQESPAQVFQVLVRDKKYMSFLPAKKNRQVDLSLQTEGTQLNLPEANTTDLKLQTAYSTEQLESRLRNTYYTARTFIEEQGANIFFLALGTLKWFEADSSQESRLAPLLLVPVELSRSSARERFRINYTEEDIFENISIIEKLREFNIKFPELPAIEEIEVERYLDDISEAVNSYPTWVVDRSAIALAFFSFGKFLMYRDLDISVWPEESRPTNHPILKALLDEGFHEQASIFTDDEHLDKHLAPDALHLVKDADSSQILAMIDVNQGRNLVIQGPPGTGKSQTITNVIAEAIGNGKTVLFVAEKMAALEVVKRRLDESRLGDACLELHSHKTNKKTVLKELERTLRIAKPQFDESDGEVKLLSQMRDRLNAYCEAINTSIGESGVAPYRAIGELIHIRQHYNYDAFPKLKINSLQNWRREEFKRHLALVEALQSRLSATGVPIKHPFWGSRLTVFLKIDSDDVKNLLLRAKDSIVYLLKVVQKIANDANLSSPNNHEEVKHLGRILNIALEAPDLQGVSIADGDWDAKHEDIVRLLSLGTKIDELFNSYKSVLISDAWKQKLEETRKNLVTYGTKWWRFLSKDYRRANKHLMSLKTNKSSISLNQKIILVDVIIEIQRLASAFRRQEGLGKKLFDKKWQGGNSNWNELRVLTDWLFELHLNIKKGNCPKEILNFLDSNHSKDSLKRSLETIERALAEQVKNMQLVFDTLKIDLAKRFGSSLDMKNQSYSLFEEMFTTWFQKIDDLYPLVAYNNLETTCQNEQIESVFNLAESWPEAHRLLVIVFQHTWYEALYRRAIEEREPLRGFVGDGGHEYLIKKFRELDTLLFEYNKAKLGNVHWQKVPREDSNGQLSILQREFQKKARHLPIRQLMARAGNAIQSLKPVFMMSPLSIANYLPPNSISFDLIVFDEASQVQPVDAFGAIIRGKQVVVVGDSKQLPPTNFFMGITDDEENEDDVTGDLESVLGLFLSQRAPERMLRWHYRSKHESLIAVSNYEFYDNRLIIFPSVDAARREVGLHYRHLPNTVYDRGKSKTNQGEAEQVALAAMRHAQTHPELTLGIAAFSMAQMEAIQTQLDILLQRDPSCEHFFSPNKQEPFFIKNLENVQGDERDVIFISIGYGRDKDGYLSMNFGPLNKNGGERRLNVLITRARQRCEVFTNLTADDLKSTNRGVESLKRFLQYAKIGILDIPRSTDREADSPFEIAVATALRHVGYKVEHQVGSAGFFIDLAIIDPDSPGRYILGIECDGATYHSARSARDRDRLRQQVLEGLGWRIHRIWSTDWFNNPNRELKRVVDAIERASAYSVSSKQEHLASNEHATIELFDELAVN